MLRFAKPDVKLSGKELDEIERIIKSGWFCEGKYIEQLEDYFRTTCNVKYTISCSSATQGLIIALKAANITNKTVALPAFTWPSTLYALECNNCTPYFTDIDLNTWNMLKPTKFIIRNKIIANEIEVLVPIDTFGNQVCLKDERPTIIDAAHGFGLSNLGKRGLAEVVSFSFTKQICGMQGGIILTDDTNLAEEAGELRRLSAKMCEINALIILSEIKRYPEKRFEKERIIDLYRYYLDVEYREQKLNKGSNISTYCILLEPEKRDRVVQKLKENNIEVKVYYKPLVEGLPNTDFVYSRIISLPVYLEMEDEIPRICKLVNEA